MSSKERMEFSCRCGWIDWEHADGGKAKDLKDAFAGSSRFFVPGIPVSPSVKLNGADAFIIRWGFSGKISNMVRDWVVKKNLPDSTLKSAALGMWDISGHEFERDQGKSLIPQSRNSSYSEEDMTSNLLSFYVAFFGMERPELSAICGTVSQKENAAMQKHSSKMQRNYSPIPVIRDCVECKGDRSFPKKFQQVQTALPGELFVPLRGRFVSPEVVRKWACNISPQNLSLHVDRYGHAELKPNA